MSEGEITSDYKIICDEQRKIHRTTLRLQAWSGEVDTVHLSVEQRDLATDDAEITQVAVPYRALLDVVLAMRTVALRELNDG